MRKLVLLLALLGTTLTLPAQLVKTEFYDLLKKLLYDSTGYTNVGDWSVGQPKKFPVKWKADRIEMSDDTSINFYRMGTADVSLNHRSYTQGGKPVTWNIMLKGARSGYSSFSILSSPGKELPTRLTIDSLLGKNRYTAKLLKSCDRNPMTGFYYYEVKLPKKDVVYLKVSWLSLNGNTALRIDGYDSWSQYAAKLACPN